ncbi:MAG: 1-acyl-sn-glycerol-3-phosphate acyltransferase [Candidatus Symbiothrix sp.]|jgi:1-acyl-sn-glycerol-3-phosphate acyltransferase|nr:1-acyl-sn-glycerol-3-phosphate acyltransferase [Candidatus Symbiothrix sp.]
MKMQALILRLIYSVVVRRALQWIIGVKFDKGSFLLKERQFIIIANHNSHLDTMTLLASIPSKILPRVKPVAAADYFGNTKFKAKISNYFINTLLISRSGGSNAIRQMKKALDDGYSLILYPEGTRGNPDEEGELKPGIALLLSLCPQVKYVPAYMTGMAKAMPKGDGLIIPYESSLIYGKPRFIESEDKKEILKQIEADFSALKARCG